MFKKDFFFFWQMLVANEFAFINVSIYIRIMIKTLKLTVLPSCRSYSLNFMFWKFLTCSELLASQLKTKTYSQELLSGEVQITNICLCLWRGRKLISLVVLFTEHYLGKQPQRKVSWISSCFSFVCPEKLLIWLDLQLWAGFMPTDFCMFLAVFSELEISVQNANNSCE